MRQTSSHDCDVVIVNYNAGRLLTECVQSVLSEQVRHVFIVDNDSHDDSLAHYKDPITRSIFSNRGYVFKDRTEFKLFVGSKTAAKKTTMLQHLEVFNPPGVT